MNVREIVVPVVAYQPYYVAYLIAHGYEDHHAADCAHGGHRLANADYMRWIHAQWRAYFAALGISSEPGHATRFNAWLLERYPTPPAKPAASPEHETR